jgi:hypothetical protein
MAPIGVGTRILNFARDLTLNPSQHRERSHARAVIELAKLVSIVSAVVAALFMIALPNIFTLALCAVIIVFAGDTHVIASNFSEILDNVVVEAQLRTDEAKIHQITKNTLVLGSIAKILVGFYPRR